MIVVGIAGPGSEATEFLTFGAATGNYRLVKLLLYKGHDPDSAGYSGSATPLEVAARGGDERMVKLLLQRGARVNFKAEIPPLMAAVKARHVEVTRLLLEAGANPHEKDYEGRTAIDLAKQPGREKILQMLLASRPEQMRQ